MSFYATVWGMVSAAAPLHDCRGFHEKATLRQAKSFGFFREFISLL
jgi:hypothetical protein